MFELLRSSAALIQTGELLRDFKTGTIRDGLTSEGRSRILSKCLDAGLINEDVWKLIAQNVQEAHDNNRRAVRVLLDKDATPPPHQASTP